MMRVITTPAVLPPEALAELKDWLGITTTTDDAALALLLAVAVDVCADFTGLVPLACACEEMLSSPATARGMPGIGDWQRCAYPREWPVESDFTWQELATRPVTGVAGVFSIAIDGTRTPVPTNLYGLALGADGSCALHLTGAGAYMRFVVQFTAGLAPGWDQLPDPLRHGIMRLAAHQYRTREGPGAEPLPPASVAALWRPWRRVRLT